MKRQPKQYQTKLPLRIAGIVFWGLAFVGLLFSVVILHYMEKQIRQENTGNFNALIIEIEDTIEISEKTDSQLTQGSTLDKRISNLKKEMGFTRVYIRDGNKILNFGENSIDDEEYVKEIRVYNKGNNQYDTIEVFAYFKNQPSIIASMRKNMLLIIGTTLFLFGYLFQRILQNLISVPFVEMVDKIQSFTNGNEKVRLDEDRQDEFGYLGKFINNAITSIVRQQEEVREALERATRSEIELGLEKERAEVALHSITDAVITLDMDECVQYMNPAAEKILGLTGEQAKRRPFRDIVSIVDEISGHVIKNPLHECYLTGNIVTLPEHSSIISGDSTVIAIEASVAPMKTDSGELMGAVMVIQDVSHTRTLTRQLSHQASHDMLTGLYNRRKFEQHLEEVLERVKIDKREHSLCYLDLDQFKIVNDTCGHIAGDELLQQLPLIFNKVLRSGDVVARLGGDEFGILLENCNIKQAAEIANKIRQEIKGFRFIWEDKSFEIGVSIGVVAINEDSISLSDIMSCADIACYAAKDAGRNRIHVYEPTDAVVSERYGEMHWISRINKSIDENRFMLYQQSIVSTTGKNPEHIEILLRMLDEDNNIIPPGAFMPAAERYNLMRNIDRWVISKVFECIKKHSLDKRIIESGGLISINLSGESLNNDGLMEYILKEKERHDISLKYICFEITETVAISNLSKANLFINEMKKYGCSFSLDDFGSGLSSFAYLKTLPVSFLKIDGSFIKHITNDDIDKAMVSTIQQVARVMQLQTVAERVENKATLDVLRIIGVDYVQGYHLGEPVPIDID